MQPRRINDAISNTTKFDRFKRVYQKILNFSCIMLKDGQTYFMSRLGLREHCVTKLLLLKLKLSFTNVELHLFFEAGF